MVRNAMFKMKIEGQYNIHDRTLICGVPEYDVIPKDMLADDIPIKLIGVSLGTKPPYMSLEIEKTNYDLVGKTILG